MTRQKAVKYLNPTGREPKGLQMGKCGCADWILFGDHKTKPWICADCGQPIAIVPADDAEITAEGKDND